MSPEGIRDTVLKETFEQWFEGQTGIPGRGNRDPEFERA